MKNQKNESDAKMHWNYRKQWYNHKSIKPYTHTYTVEPP